MKRFGLQSHYRTLEGQAEVIDLPPVEVVDMRQELKAGNRSIFSRSLTQGLEEILSRGQQAILFLNRRGTSTYVFCRDCGYSLKCPNCDLPLTLHSPQDRLICHHCGYRRNMPGKCPECGETRIRQFGTGTEKVEADVQALFPGCRTLRWDHETTRKKGAHDVILSKFSARQADVLVGTQMLAKGLDLPLVTLVGVVLADVGLSLPDFSAPERTFQVLTQVAGRAGRSPLGGRVVLQTFQPDHYVIQAASGHSYDAFYKQELSYRRELGYPPFARLVRLEYRHLNAEKAEQQAHKLASQVRDWIREEQRSATEVIGPVPCFFSRVSGLYRWQIVIRGPDPASLLRGRALGDWRLEVNPPSLL
jgi:primosomal protein N' (replication factor Y)